MQCAYGSFQGVVPLPTPVRTSYRNGVLGVELPEQVESRPVAISVKID